MTDRASSIPADIEEKLSSNTDLSFMLPVSLVRNIIEVPIISVNDGKGGIKKSLP